METGQWFLVPQSRHAEGVEDRDISQSRALGAQCEPRTPPSANPAPFPLPLLRKGQPFMGTRTSPGPSHILRPCNSHTRGSLHRGLWPFHLHIQAWQCFSKAEPVYSYLHLPKELAGALTCRLSPDPEQLRSYFLPVGRGEERGT